MPTEIDLDAWRAQALGLCRHRNWSERWDARLAQHTLEAAEFSEALRDKKGDPIEEAGDLIFTALAMIPESISLEAVFARNQIKVAEMFEKPPYVGEQREPIPEPAQEAVAPALDETAACRSCGAVVTYHASGCKGRPGHQPECNLPGIDCPCSVPALDAGEQCLCWRIHPECGCNCHE